MKVVYPVILVILCLTNLNYLLATDSIIADAEQKQEEKFKEYEHRIQLLQDELRIYKKFSFLMKKKVEVRITAYNQTGITAILQNPVQGRTCAVSRDLMNWLGSWIYISGHGMYFVNDLTHERFTTTVDLFMHSKKEAEKFGVKTSWATNLH